MPNEMSLIQAAIEQGLWSAQVIAEESCIPYAVVTQIMKEMSVYSEAPYGKAPYGRCRSVSTEGTIVLRRVSVVGQMSYDRNIYTLGRPYRGRIAHIILSNCLLNCHFIDRPSLQLTVRAGRAHS